MSAIHWIRETETRVVTRYVTTHCGMTGRSDPHSSRFIDMAGLHNRQFEAAETFDAVTCKRCIRCGQRILEGKPATRPYPKSST